MKTLNIYFVNITKTLSFYFKDHNSINNFKKNYDKSCEKFSFQTVSLEDIEKFMKFLDIKTSSFSEGIPASILKVHLNTYLFYLT